MVTFVFTKQSEKIFKKLSATIQHRIVYKLSELKTHPDIFSVLKPLVNFHPATHRLRIGMFRLILELKKNTKESIEFWILDVGNRKDIYL